MVVVHRPLDVQLEEVSREDAERVRAQPYLTIDFDSLHPFAKRGRIPPVIQGLTGQHTDRS
jgi:hypothetical protein